tara:strand:- start:35 stop:421 length:387 start_codon:yes stop_codon:yes gene_type:complete
MNSPKLFQLTEKDKIHYKNLIEKIDISQKNEIIGILGMKIASLLNEDKLNSVEEELIEDMAKLVKILEIHTELSEIIVRKILFAMSYFIDENDEIPDIIPNYGYLDDITVVTWIMNDIEEKIPKIANA